MGDQTELPTAPATSIPVVTAEQMREVDRVAVEEFDLLLIQMMEMERRGGATVGDRLGSLLFAQGLFEPALAVWQQLVERLRPILGPEDPLILSSMSNLAGMLHVLGDLAGSRRIQEQVLASRTVLGPEHPDTLTSMSNLAETLRAVGAPG